MHIAFLAVWSAALLYMPYLLARQAQDDEGMRVQLEHMQRWIYAYVMTPSAVGTVIFGIWLVFERGFEGGWLPVKLALVVAMGLFHAYCGYLMIRMKLGATHRPLYYRVLPIAPAVLIVAIVTLVTGKPF